jgi:PAS domain S-box-containing protein
MQQPEGEASRTRGDALQIVYVGDETRAAAVSEKLSDAEVRSEACGGTALDRIEDAEVDCVVAETDLGDVAGPEFLGAVAELYPGVARVMLAESVGEAPGNVAFVPARPQAGVPARVARRVERAVEYRSAVNDRTAADEPDLFGDRVEQLPDPILTIDDDCEVVFANEAIERVFGRGPEDVVGESVLGLLDESVHESFEASVNDLSGDEGQLERDYVELPGRHHDGREIPLAVSFRENERSDGSYFSAVLRDVSERKQLEDRLEAEKRKTKELHEVAVMLEGCDTAEAVCRLAVETAEQLLEFDLCAVDTIENGELVPQAVSKGVPTDGYYMTTPVSTEDNLAARAYRRGESLRTADIHDEGVDPAASGYQAALTVPIGDLGVFQAVSKEADAFDESDCELAELLASHVAQSLQRIRSESELQAERDRFAALFENVPEPTARYELRDGEPLIQSVNEAFEETFGHSESDALDQSIDDLLVPDDQQTEAGQLNERVRQGERVDAEVKRLAEDGVRDFLLRNAEVSGDAGNYVIYTDITERKQREEMLDALHRATRDLMSAERQRDICETAVEMARNVLDIPHATVFRWDEGSELLEPYILPEDTVSDIGDAPAFESGEGIVGNVFETGESAYFDNAWSDPRTLDDGSEGVRAFGAFPLGNWGVMTVASTSVAAFDDYEMDLVRVLAANTEVALNRAAREAELADQRSQLAELDRINDVIRDVDQLLVRASTREEIEQAVCDRLADSDQYRFAWIGEAMAGSNLPQQTAWAGIEEGYLEEISAARDESPRRPSQTALETGDVQVVQSVPEDDCFAPWREQALERGYRSMAAIPLRYRETVYGVLCVYADRANAFDAREQAVLAELGETIGHAINAAESKKALLSDAVVEVEFEIYDGEGFFARVPREEGGVFTLDGVTMTSDGSFVYFMTVDGLDPDRVLERAQDAHDVSGARLVNEHEDGNLFEFVYTGPSPLQELADRGGTLRDAKFTANGGRSVVELPRNVDVRSAVESIQDSMSGTEVVARRERERPERTVEEFRSTLEDDLTERQRSALDAAYYAGFFEWPRESTGEEVSESLGVSAPTFHQHLRVGNRKLVSAFLNE